MDPSKAYLTVFNSTPHERRLAVLLGVPLNGCDPLLAHLGTETREAGRCSARTGVDLPVGFEDLHTPHDVEEALVELRGRRPGIRRAGIVKLRRELPARATLPAALPRVERPTGAARGDAAGGVLGVAFQNTEAYFDKFAKMGGTSRSSSRPRRERSPSAQLRVGPRGDILVISTHDQILGGQGQVFLGCRFPARRRLPGLRIRRRERGSPASSPRRRQPLRGGLPRVYRDDPRRRLEAHRPRDQPSHGGHKPPLSGLAVPHRGQPRPRHRALPLPERPRQVLQGDRQPLLGAVPGAAA